MSKCVRIIPLLLAAAPLFGSAFSFSSPGCGQPVSGVQMLNVAGADASAYRVEYAMGSHRLGAATAPGFAIPWNSAEAMDGVSAIQASARDVTGKEVGAAECLVTVSNRQASLSVNAPDLGQALSGTVTITVTGADALAFPAVWTLNIDGGQQAIVWTDNTWQSPLTVSFSLDTTQFSNGKHELHISMNSRSGPSQPQWVNWRGMVNRVVTISNGQSWSQSLPQFQSLHLQPGNSVPLGCVRLFSDGSSGACSSPSYQSTDSSVAAVDGTGMVSAGQAGFAQITLTDGPKTSTASVWVTGDSHVPHFTGSGEMRMGYREGKSLFVIAPFFLDSNTVSQDAALWQEVMRAGVNALGFGVYVNPRDTITAFSDWQTNYDQTVTPQMQWARDNGFHLLLTGDDIFREIGTDAWFTLNWPWGSQAVQYAVSTLAGTGVGIGIEGIDEGSSIWGPRPTPAGRIGAASYLFNEVDCGSGSCGVLWPSNPVPNGWGFALQGSPGQLDTPAGSLFTAQQSTGGGFQFQAALPVTGTFQAATTPNLEYLWFAGPYCGNGQACTPPVPNEALGIMRSWMTAVPNRAMMAFPPLAVDGPDVDGAWMGPGSVSDYASNYFSSLKTRTTYPWSEGIQEMISSMEALFFERQPYFMLDRPQLMLVSLAGASYTKGSGSSATFDPGSDALDEPGVSPEHVSAVMMDAAALGGAGTRLYFFEPSTDASSRSAAPAGTYYQTGANPSNLQTGSWRAMGYASNLLTKVLERYLFGSAGNAPAFGSNITSAVRQGSDGVLLLVVNGNDWGRRIPVDFSPYPHAFGAARYRISASGIATDLLPPDEAGETIHLGAGESAAYLFPATAAAMPLQQVVLNPAADAPAIVGVQYAYVYQNDFDRRPVAACEAGCTVAVDPRLGAFFYRFVTAAPAGTTSVFQFSAQPTTVAPSSSPAALR